VEEEDDEEEGEGHDDDNDGADEDGEHGEDDVGNALFDHYDEDFEEEMEDGDEDEEMEGGHMTVHDLHVDPPAAGAAAAGASAAAASLQQSSGKSAGTAAAAAGTATASRGDAAAGAAGAAGAAAGAGAGASTAAAGAGAGARGQQRPTTAAAAVGAEAPKLVFYMGERRLSPSTTVFEAIQSAEAAAAGHEEGLPYEEDMAGASTAGAGAGGAARRSRRLWEDIHTLHYRLGSSVAAEGGSSRQPAAAGPASSSGPAAKAGGESRWSCSPLVELLHSRVPDDLAAGQACKEVLQLLQLLEALNRLGPRVEATLGGGAAAGTPAASSAAQAAVGRACISSSEPDAVQRSPGHVPREEFISSKLGSKLSQQLKDVLAICGGCIPPWCRQLVFTCKFLFPFDVRRRYFHCTAFGLSRTLQHVQQMHTAEGGVAPVADREGRELRVGRLQRQKVRVSRRRILESAVKVMELYARNRAVLELEYFGEVGTGLGPTLEFYTLLSHELQKRSLGMWRHEDNVSADAMDLDGQPQPGGHRPAAVVEKGAEVWHEVSEYVHAPWGLFPAPLPPAARAASKQLDHFRLLGRTLGKALQDCRLLDLPLSYVFYRAVLGKRLDLHDIPHFDPQLGNSLLRMRAALEGHKGGIGLLLVDGVPLCDLCLTFTLPGYPEYELVEGGAERLVEEHNLGAYIDAVVDATLGSGIEAQLTAFREGFNEVFPLDTLACFYEDEIETLLCGSGERWSVQGLADSIKFDHGYMPSSPVVRCFLEVLAELDAADQRRFLRFVTGCPRLPPGGIASLQPRLTVVRKHPPSPGADSATPGSTPVGSFKDAGGGTTAADADLPSVMTCANYLKLPPYSSKQVMTERLLFAIREGQGSFDLS